MYFNSGIFLQFLWTVFWKHCYYETLILGAAATAKGKILKIKLDIFILKWIIPRRLQLFQKPLKAKKIDEGQPDDQLCPRL